MEESKPEVVACTFGVSETPTVTEVPPQIVKCTFDNVEANKVDPQECGKEDEEKCKRGDTTFPSCPQCGKADSVVKIVFGYPSPELMQHAKDGKVALGGCCPPMDGEQPRKHKCNSCNEEFCNMI